MSSDPSKGSWQARPEDYKETFKRRRYDSEFADPCAEASKASMDCLNRNDYDRDKCLDFFRAYRDCKSAWMEQRKADRRAGTQIYSTPTRD
ncbi:hypothetical protein PENSPDRAFT_605680 [Peniophora sp. CONT]|nr:hypothetical protein PENSPDRAFT_605680 [Peniophora sp. CONT]